ncbi:MAG: dihydrodipicolinate synthase family protein [Acidobacteria bacterium]|nr:dihydrodipicolinate synthase family protein [Acidobacteriota bacterium]
MNRRNFTKLMGIGAVAAGSGVLGSSAEPTASAEPALRPSDNFPKVDKANLKEWAREYIKGLECVISMSYKPLTLELDEEGIRWDMQLNVRHGFKSVLGGGGGPGEEGARVRKIVLEEAAKGKMMVAAGGGGQTVESSIRSINAAEKEGYTHVFLGWPNNFRPTSEEEIYRHFAKICEGINMPVVLYASERFDFVRFHLSGVPFNVFDRLVEIPNVVAMKIGFFEPGLCFELFERYSKKVLVNIGNPQMVGQFPVLHRLYRPQWAGAGSWEIWQSPEKPYMVDYFDLVSKGEYEKAMKIYWQMYPLHRYAMAKIAHGYGERYQADAALAKYISWSVGGNGGPVRGGNVIYEAQMEERKQVLRAAGITPREPDEEFFVGRVNYGKGMRLADVNKAADL